MKVIKPVDVVDANFVSSTAPEADYTAWNAATNYSVNDKVIRTSTHRIYTCLVAGISAIAPESDGVKWDDTSPTNRWAMFDSTISTATSLASPLTVVIKDKLANSLALFGLVGTSVTITKRDALAGTIVYTQTKDLDGTIIIDWYGYFFEPAVQLAEAVFTDLPPYGDGHTTISITGTGTVACGALVIGSFYYLGETLSSPTVSILDFSRKETDSFGVTSFIERAFSKQMSAKLMLDKASFNKVHSILASVRAKPSVWIGTDDIGYEPLTLLGFPKSFNIEVPYPDILFCSLDIEGLT